MNFEKTTGFFKSSNGLYNTAYYIYTPVNEKARGVVQIVHGMCEYIARYEDFIDFLCGKGFIVCGNDHIGHGSSVNSEDDLGFFGDKNGWRYLVKDVVTLTRMMQERYASFPYYILGHSMGSLVVRTTLAKYSELYDGALILGTISLRFGADACLAVIESAAKIKGKRFRSKALDRMMFGMSNMKIENPVTDYDWVSSDRNVIDKYAADPYCTFIFTVQTMYDLVMLVKYVSTKDWAEKVADYLPVFIAGGSDDPVGRYGRCLTDLFKRMTDAGSEDAELHIYPGMRHEILNEVDKQEVYDDILDWLEEHMENC